MVQDAGTGLTNVVLWDLAFRAFAQHSSLNSTATWFSTELWSILMQYSDPNGPSRVGPHTPQAAPQKAITWFADGFGQRLTIWNTAQPFTEPYALRPYALQQMLRGCKVYSSRASPALRIQQNLTGLSAPYRQAASGLGNWVLADAVAADRRHLVAVVGELHGLPHCRGGSHLAGKEDENGDAAWRIEYVGNIPLLPVRLARGAGVSYTVSQAVPPHGPAGPR